MIRKMNHVCIYVLDQESAYDFYVNKLGFKVHTYAEMGPGMYWLTVCPPEQPDLELTILPVQEGMMMDKETAEQLKSLIKKGIFGFGIFECNDLPATYQELKSKGVVFKKAPKKEFYGYEAIFLDDSGNWFSLAEKAKDKSINL
ncbi:glyoxalase [Solitalea longa]|uniref:Glyoxalase n=1 Tax=Solitalea longa TaxID=2079460 RepID=A0A2S4ZYP5_9SPHI|nr:VOC family protein [Solitalea longa]POY35169.1 glyoxalase [Solitalea longa]